MTTDSTSAGRAGAARTPRRGVLLLAGAVAVTGLLAGCGAGQNTQTDSKAPSVPGVHADVGSISLRNVQITYGGRDQRSYPEGGSAPLDVRMFNTGATTDTLVSVSSEAAERVELVSTDAEGSGACPTASVSAPAAAPTDQPSPGTGEEAPGTSPGAESPGAESPSAAPSGSPAEGETSPEAPAGSTEFAVELKPNSCALLALDQPHYLSLAGLREEIAPGRTVPVTFEFAEAGEVTLEVPVGSPTDGADHSPINIHPTEPEEVGGGHGDDAEGDHE